MIKILTLKSKQISSCSILLYQTKFDPTDPKTNQATLTIRKTSTKFQLFLHKKNRNRKESQFNEVFSVILWHNKNGINS